jgi:hypothetical protein
MKYFVKDFLKTDTRFSETFWTKEQLVFNALIWKNGYRTFQPSQKLQEIMGLDRPKDMAIFWHTSEPVFHGEVTGKVELYKIWEKSIFPFP